MAGPSSQFLAALNAGLEPSLDMPADTITPNGARMAPPPAVYNAPPPADQWQPTDPLAGIKPANQAGASWTQYDPLKRDAEPTPREPVSVARGEPGTPPAASPENPYLQANPGDVEFKPVKVGAQPAREVPVRGPQQNALLERSFEYPIVAAGDIAQRSTEQAAREQAMYEEQAERYQEQQAAMMRVQARREQELQHLRDNYSQTIDQLSTMKVDNNRVWNNASTMDKIGATLLVMLGAFGGTGGDQSKNLPLQAVMGRIKDDVENQKRAYDLGLNLAKGQQTAYAMAMDQYGSEDAAYHAAMAAGQQAVAAKISGMGAQWKGTEAQNKAQAIQGEILSAADKNRADGLKYLQPTAGANKYQMTIRGQRLPGFVDEKRAQDVALEHGVKPAERTDEELVKGGIAQSTEAMKLRAAAAKDQKKHEVKLPNGEVVSAPSGEEADKLRELTVSGEKTRRLVEQAKKIREDSTFRVSPQGGAKLKQIQAELVTQFGVQNKLGALSSADMDLAVEGTADLFRWGNGVEARLDRLSQEAIRGRIDRVATYPGAPPKSSGVMPSGFQPASGAK